MELMIKTMLLVCVGVMGASQIASASSNDSGTLTPGQVSHICTPFMPGADLISTGFGPSLGTYSPTGLTGGFTLVTLDDVANQCRELTYSNLVVSGFAADPGSQWLISVTCNGVKELQGAASYSYSDGIAGWSWGSRFGLSNGSQVSCTISHN